MTTRIVVDRTVEYIAARGITFIDVEALMRATPNFEEDKPHCVDVIANTANSDGKCWLIETKDYRKVAAYGKSPRINGLDNKLFRKLQDTVNFAESSAYCLELRSGFPPSEKRSFVFHFELPKGGKNPYLPSGFPLTIYQSFLSKLQSGLVAKTYFVTSDDINSNPDLPWTVQLNPVFP